MSFRLRHEQHPNAFGKDPTTWVLEDDAGNRLDVWPALGFNAFRWSASGADLLDCDPTFFEIQKPTRSGFPILFPFPNRIRDGRFSHDGRSYQLPLNDPTQRNAIHGFALNEMWTAEAIVGDSDAILRGRIDLQMPLWPASARLTVEYRLGVNSLHVVARVESLDRPLPFGLGYHPYFRVEPFGGGEAIVRVAANEILELVDSLPTGRRLSPDPSKDLRRGLAFAGLSLDDAYTSLTGGAGPVATLTHPNGSRQLEMFVSPEFRDFVAFIPPHRRSIALEPYTCTTDAINMRDSGWRELPANSSWDATVRLEYHDRSATECVQV